MADIFPELISGFDDEGNAILQLGDNASVAKQQLEELIDAQRRSAAAEIAQHVPELYGGIQEYAREFGKQDLQYRQMKSDVNQLFDVDFSQDSIKFDEVASNMRDAFERALQKTGLSDVVQSQTFFGSVDEGSYSAYDITLLTPEKRAELESAYKEEARELAAARGQCIAEQFGKRSAAEADLKKAISEIMPSVFAALETSGSYEELDDSLKSQIKAQIGQIKFTDPQIQNAIAANENGLLGFIKDTYVTPLYDARPQFKRAYKNFLSVISNKDMKRSAGDYLSSIDGVVNDLSEVLGVGTEEVEQRFGVKAITDKINDQINAVSKQIKGGNIETLSLQDLSEASRLVAQGYTGTFSELKTEIANVKKYAANIKDLSGEINQYVAAANAARTATDEYNSSGTLTADTVQELRSNFEDIDEVLTVNADGYSINTDKLAELNAEMGSKRIEELIQNTTDLKKQYDRNAKSLDELMTKYLSGNRLTKEEAANLLANIRVRQENIGQIANQIRVNEDLIASINSTISSYSQLKQAMSAPSSGARYDEVLGYREQVEKLVEQGLIGDDKIAEFVQYFTGLDTAAMTAEEVMEHWGDAIKKSKKYFTEDASGINNFIEELSNNNYLDDLGDGKVKLKDGLDIGDVASKFGVSTSMIIQAFDKLKQYGWDIDYNYESINLEEPLTMIEQIDKQLEALDGQKATVDVDTEDGQRQLDEIDQQIKRLTAKKHTIEVIVNPSSDENGSKALSRIQELENMKVNYKLSDKGLENIIQEQQKIADENNLDLTMILNLDTEEAKGEFDTTKSDIENSQINLKADASGIYNAGILALQKVNQYQIQHPIKLNTGNEDSSSKAQSGRSNAYGTSNSPGGKTLVGELGREMVVDRSTGTYHTVGDNGPEFVNLKPGDIVFNHEQTEDLMSNGHTGSHGKALAPGNVPGFSVGGGGSRTVGSSSSNSGSKSKGGSGSNSSSDSSSKLSKKDFDWIQRRIEIEQRNNDKFRDVIDDRYTIYKGSVSDSEEYIAAQERLAKAQKRLEELGIDPLNYQPPTADGIVHPSQGTGQYPDGWMAAVDQNDTIPQWLKDANVGGGPVSVLGAMDENLQAVNDGLSDMYSSSELALKEYQDAKAALENFDVSKVNTERSQLETLEDLKASDRKMISYYEKAAEEYGHQWEEYKSKIIEAFGEEAGKQWIEDIENGNIDPTAAERRIEYENSNDAVAENVALLDDGEAIYDKQLDSIKSITEWTKKLEEDEQKRYEIELNILKAQQAQIQNLADTAQWELDMKSTLGEVVQESDYQALIDINDDLISNYEEQLDVLNEQLGTLDEGEQAWYDCQSSIYECENAIREARKQQAEWNDIILRLPVENMQRFLKLLQNIGKDLENFMAIQEAMGKDTTVNQIGKQWEDALDQITADQGGFNAQAEKWLDILENYDLGSDKFSEVDDAIQECEDSVTSLIESMVELNSQLLNLPIDRIAEMTEYLNGTLSDLQSVQSEFETAINSVINAITDEQDRLQKEYDDLEESINDQIKPLEDALEQLEKQNDQRSRQLAIEKAQLELAKQQEQHTLQVIRNGQVQYESDQSAIRDAQEGLADAEYNKLIGDLNDQIDALNEQLETASDQLDDAVKDLTKILDERWETIMPDTETARNEEIATRIFGEGWKELVLAGKNSNGVYADEAIYQAMRRAYEENSEQQRDVDNQIKTNELITSTLQRYVEDFQAEKITAEEMSEKISTLMNIVSDSLVTGQEALRNTLTMGGYETLGNALSAANTLRENQLGVFNENLLIAQERRDQIDDLMLDWEEFAQKFDEYRDQLKADWAAIDFIGEKVSIIQDNSDDSDDGNVTSYWDGPDSRNPDDYRGDASYNDIGHYSDGLERGQIGKLSSSEKFKAIQALGLKKLEPDEIPAILHAGEGVINGRQQSNILSNMSGALSIGAGNKLGAMVNISMGDLTLPNVTNGKEFAESLAQNFTPIMNQYFSKVFNK